MTTDLNKRDWIAGLEYGLAVIAAFDHANPRLTATQAAERAGLTRTAPRRYLLTLVHLGYAASDGKLFWLTPRVLRLGWSYLESARLPRTVQPYLQRITGLVGEAAYCAVLDGDEVVYVARNGVNRVQNVGFVLGARVPASVSSAGIAMLSTRPPEQVEAWLARQTFHPFTPFTMIDRTSVRQAIDRARMTGYALLEQQMEQNVRGIAVSLRNRVGEVVGALSVSLVMSKESTEQTVERVLPILLEGAHSLLNAV